MRPFLPALIWATMVVVATWPIMERVQGRLWKKRGLAVAVMTLLLTLMLMGPLALAIGALVGQVDRLSNLPATLATFTLPAPPAWLTKLPLAGAKLTQKWQEIAAMPPEELGVKLTPYVRDVLEWLLAKAGAFGGTVIQFLLIILISAILYTNGETAVTGVKAFMKRLAGGQGERLVVLAGQAIRAVALGVIVTALVQSVLAGLGLLVSGVPNVGILTAIMFLFGIAQLGPLPVMVPAVIWLFYRGSVGWGSFLLVWTIFVGVMDNVLRPVLIKRGASLPLMLILTGVIGGLLAFGVIGLFIGPVVLAVAYTLVGAWVEGGTSPTSASNKGPAATPG
jgi:predicted PurR-regulated permease PerM